MDIKFTSLYQIDHLLNTIVEVDIDNQSEDLSDYISRLIIEITEGTSKRKFEFRRETTEIRRIIDEFVSGDYSNKRVNAQRLLDSEVQAQEIVNRLGIQIPKGSLFQALVENGDETIVVITKADQLSFLDGIDFTLKSGLPWEKKIFKAFLISFIGNEIKDIFVYDTSTKLSRYWWDTFLELEEVYTSKFNTKTALNLIKGKVFTTIKKKFKADYINIRNAMVGYFQNKETFEMESFLNDTINNYTPVDSLFPKQKTIDMIKSLPEKYSFDSQFPIDSEEVTLKNVKTNINLTDRIELILKENIPDLTSSVKVYRDEEQRKWITIRSDEGYEYFSGNQISIEEEE